MDGSLVEGHERAALQAISFLQKLYGFVVVDYNFEGVLLCSRVARTAVFGAARATGILGGLARERHDLVLQAECLMREVSLLNLLV